MSQSVKHIIAAVFLLAVGLYAASQNPPGRLYIADTAIELVAKANTNYVVTDWRGGVIQQGRIAQDGKLALPSLPPGYYTVTGDDGNYELPFGVIASPSQLQTRDAMPYAVDAAISGMASVLSFPSGDGFGYYAGLCHTTGIRQVRERISWALMNPERGKFAPARYDDVADKYAQNGVGVCAVWHDAPSWCEKRNGLPDDPQACFEFARWLSAHFKGRIDAWEYWNEMEGNGFENGCWAFATMAKAAYLGLKAGNPECEVLSGSFCTRPERFGFWEALCRNGFTDYMEIYNYHVYEPLPEYPAMMASLHKALEEAGCPDMPIRVTENSIWQAPMVLCEHKIVVDGQERLVQTASQELTTAEAMVKMQLLLASFGIDRTYSFVLPPYNEGNTDWSMVRYDHSAKPALVAFSNMIHQLGNAEYRGEIKTDDAQLRALCFEQADGTWSAVCWSASALESTADQTRTLHIPVLPDASQCDFFGKRTPLEIEEGMASVQLDRFPVYLHAIKQPETLSNRPRETFKGATYSAQDKDIVMQLIPSDAFRVSKSKLALIFKPEADALPRLTLRIFNFSAEAKTVRLDEIPGMTLTPSTLEIPAFGKQDATILLGDGKDAHFSTRFHVTGTANDLSISPLDFTVQRNDALLDEWQAIPGAMNPLNWKENSSGKMRISYDKARDAMRFECEFAPNCPDRWAYPYLELKDADELGKIAAIRFEVTAEQTADEVSRNNLVMLQDGVWIHYQPSAGQPVDNLVEIPVPSQLKTIGIGMNPTKNTIVWYIRNMRYQPAQR